MGRFHDRTFPGESAGYRAARDELLAAEIDLRRRIEEVAAMRRALPPGGKVAQDYTFDEGPADLGADGPARNVRLSELFAPGQDSLVIYSFMYAPDAEAPCPMCTSMLDGLDGNAPHIVQRTNLAVVGKAPLETLRLFARSRGWRHLRLLSSHGNSYNSDYWGEDPEFGQMPALNVFRRTPDGIFHSWGAEMLFGPSEEGMNMRHVDALWPLWNVLDLTPEGRETDWYPKLSYD